MLIKAPERPIDAFKGGALKTAVALCFFPALLVIRTDAWSHPWLVIGMGLGFVITAAILVGLGCAVWARVHRWAYDRATHNEHFPR